MTLFTKLPRTRASTKLLTAFPKTEIAGDGSRPLYVHPPSHSHPTPHSAHPQVDAHVSILRGDVRDAASASIAAFHITDPDQATEYLLQDLTYIYPVDPFVSVDSFAPSHVYHSHPLSPERCRATNRIVIRPLSRLSDMSFSTVHLPPLTMEFTTHPFPNWMSMKSQFRWLLLLQLR